MARHDNPAPTRSFAGRARLSRAVWHTIGLILALLFAYAIWRGYQAPDFVLDLSAFRLC